MSTNFSSSLLLADLDYIAPAQACVLPTIQQQNKQKQTVSLRMGDDEGTIQLHKPASDVVVQHQNFATLEKVQITLADCLACSGCVTSAETILITNQSREEVQRIVSSSSSSSILVSVSEQSIAAAAVEWKTTFPLALRKIAAFCREVLNASQVVALDWAQTVSSLETGFEFVRRMNQQSSLAASSSSSPLLQTLIVSSCPGWVCYCEKTHPSLLPHLSPIMSAQAIAGKTWKLGWSTHNHHSNEKKIHISVQPCFDKKLEAVRPELSVPTKNNEANDKGEEEEEQKKNFYTDCVLSTKELLDWIAEMPTTLSEDEEASTISSSTPLFSLSSAEAKDTHFNALSNAKESTQKKEEQFYSACVSGAYHLVAMACLAKSRGIQNFDLSQVQYTERRGNRNFRIATHPLLATLCSNEEEETEKADDSNVQQQQQQQQQPKKLLQFALVYGFQHIQNVVRSFESLQKSTTATKSTSSNRLLAVGRRLAKTAPASSQSNNNNNNNSNSTDSTDFCFIEMMACPSGCTNGGGQLMNKTLDPEQQKERLHKIDLIFADHFWKKQQRHCHNVDGDGGDDDDVLFRPERVYRDLMMNEADATLTVQFKDRRKEMEEKLNNGNIVSLKW